MSKRGTETADRRTFTRVLKLLISLGFFLLARGRAALRRLAGRPPDAVCIILYYHCVAQEHRARFARQMDLLLRWATTTSIDRCSALQAGSRYAAVTFDDGFESVGEQALPELVKRRIPATVFVTSDLMGQVPGWKGYPGRLMSLDQLRALPRDLITFGSHTKTHAFLPDLTDEEAKKEIGDSRIKLEKMLGRDIKLFSFPCGGFDDRTIEWCRELGYQRVFTTLPLPTRLGPEEFVLGRVWAEPTDWQLEFFLKVQGAYRWLPLAFELKRRFRLVFTGHHLQAAPTPGAGQHGS